MSRDRREAWREIPIAPGYEVSDLGRVRSWKAPRPNAEAPTRPQLLKLTVAREGYLRVSLCVSWSHRSQKWFFVHRLVLMAFVGPAPGGLLVRHLNGNPADNRLENLRYGTFTENYADAVRHGTSTRGERVWCATLTRHQVEAIRFAHSLGRFSGREIARRLGVSRHAVKDCLGGRTWTWLGNPWKDGAI